MEKSVINQIVVQLEQCFTQLSVRTSEEELEKITLLIHTSLTSYGRKFHTPEHIFEICKDLHHPLQILSALFHDLVYFQVDGGLPEKAKSTLEQFLVINDLEVFTKEAAKIQEPLFELCLNVFAFEYEQKLSPFQGLNEFLSALLALLTLKKILPLKDLLAIAACIEATIPFRKPDEKGENHLYQLEDRLSKINLKFSLGISQEEIEQIVKMALDVANLDVLNFSSEDVGVFLVNTWLLISEANSDLSNAKARSYAFSIAQYRQALMKTESFIRNLNAEDVFHQYKNFPEDGLYQHLEEKAHNNLKVAREYLAVKLFTMGVVEALANLTGGDAPLSMFMGDIRDEKHPDMERAEDYLSTTELQSEIDVNPQVLYLLDHGRASESDFDMNRSPLSAFIYKSIGSEKIQLYLEHAKKMFEGHLSTVHFIHIIDKKIVKEIAIACSRVALTRKKSLEKIYSQLQ